jgi:hypothetical protein
MGWISWAAGTIAILLLWGRGHPALLAVAVISTLGAFWTHGIMHNQLVDAAIRNRRFSGARLFAATGDLNSVSNQVTFANFVCSVLCIGLFVSAMILSVS